MQNRKEIKLKNYERIFDNRMVELSENFFEKMNQRRTVRTFSDESFSVSVIENAIRTASTAPSGANKQPWHFVVVQDPDLKKRIRIAAEKKEHEFYNGKATKEWLDDLAVFGTNENKEFLEIAPYLIVVFEEKYRIDNNGNKKNNYYTKESVGLATGILLTALHNVGIATLTHTPSPMNFLSEILNRPKNETPFLLIVAGFPKDDTMVPDIERKKINEILTLY